MWLLAAALLLRDSLGPALIIGTLGSWINIRGDFCNLLFFFFFCLFLGKGSPTAFGRPWTFLFTREGIFPLESDLDAYFALGDLP